MVLGELLVHGRDALDPFGHARLDDPEDALAVLDTCRRVGRLAFHAHSTRGVRLRATDVKWSSGAGPEVRGRAIDLLLLLANRRDVPASLDGPGVALLD